MIEYPFVIIVILKYNNIDPKKIIALSIYLVRWQLF